MEYFSIIWSYIGIINDIGKSVEGIYLLDMGAEDLNIPAGTLNLTQTEKPELQLLLTLQEDDVRTGNKKTFMRVYADVWDLVELSGQMLKLTYT